MGRDGVYENLIRRSVRGKGCGLFQGVF